MWPAMLKVVPTVSLPLLVVVQMRTVILVPAAVAAAVSLVQMDVWLCVLQQQIRMSCATTIAGIE